MAGRSGRAGVSRGKKGTLADQSVNTGAGESFLILPVKVYLCVCPLISWEAFFRRLCDMLQSLVDGSVRSRRGFSVI